MKLLDAVNTVLPYLGEHPVTDIDTTHPTVDLIVKAIDRQRQALLAEGWWFNEGTVTLPVNTDGKIDTPTGIISIYGLDCDVEIDGANLRDTYNNSEYFSAPITVELIKDTPFEKLPLYAAHVCLYNAATEVYTADFGVESSVQVLQSLSENARMKLNQENLRKRRYNSSAFRRPSGYARFRSVIKFR